MKRSLAVTLIALLLVVLFSETADAQRRRRRRPPPPPETEEVEEPVEALPVAERVVPPGSPGQIPHGAPGAVPRTPDPLAEPSSDPTEEYDPGPAPPDVGPIRTDFVALMDDLVQARMRVSALGAELFRTRITVGFQDRTGANVTLARVVVHLDGAPVFQNDGPVEDGANGRQIFTGALAPGPHVLRIEVDQRSRDDDAYRYELQQSFRFQVHRERLTEVTLVLEDDSDIARNFPSGGEGRYEVRTRMRVATRALPSQ